VPGAVVATLALLLTLAAPAAAFRGGSVDDPAHRNPVTDGPTGKTYLLNNGWDPAHDTTLVVGNHYDRVYTGDFTGNGRDTVVWRRGNTYALGRCALGYGRVNDETFVGDWDGDGTDTLAVRRGRTIYASDTPCSTRADHVFDYGRPGDVLLVGDFDGDGTDTFTVRRGNTYHVKNTLTGGRADRVITYGRTGDTILVGDWDGNGTDTLGVRRPDPIPAPRNRYEQIAATYGMSVSFDAGDNLCGAGKVGCFGPAVPYIWLSMTSKREPRPAARIEHSAWHEVGHSLQYRACGSIRLPRVEPVANALADRLQRTSTRWEGVTAQDQRDAVTILAGLCPQ